MAQLAQERALGKKSCYVFELQPLDTGYLYRIMAWEFKKRNKIEMFKYINLNTKPFIENTELANELRSEEISNFHRALQKENCQR